MRSEKEQIVKDVTKKQQEIESCVFKFLYEQHPIKISNSHNNQTHHFS